MPEKITTENLLSNIVESLGELQRQASGSSIDDLSDSVTTGFKRLFGRQKPIHHIFGGGRSADVLLWRNKKISASFLGGATVIWVLFEWLNYHLLTILCLLVVLGMVVQFGWSNASGFVSRARSPSQVPRIELPEQLFVNLAVTVGAEVNKALGYLQDVACSANLKQFLLVVASLWAAAIIGSWCNFLTVIYIGFVAAHTLPVLYERYEDEVDSFVDNLMGQMQHHYRKVDGRLLSRGARRFMGWKRD